VGDVPVTERGRSDIGDRVHRAGRERFGDRLARQVAARRSQLVLGLDPDPARLWPQALELERGASEADASPGRRAAHAVAIHCALAIDAVAEHCVAVKLQLACFERLGPAGLTVLGEVAAHARRHELLVIADAKRGDIDVSAAAYAQAFFGGLDTPYGLVAGLGADAITVNPLLGGDSLEPLIAGARNRGGGLFVLVRTSNPGAADVQDLRCEDGDTVSEHLAGLVQRLGRDGVGEAGLSDVGAVVGATAPQHLTALRELMPAAVFLLPGVGAQGGRVEDLAGAFVPGPGGGLVTVSRSLVQAHERRGGDPARAAAHEAGRLRELAWRLSA
jgi:orotidine-5'-phosphate decarboxylase